MGQRRLAYPIGVYREGSYFIIVFDAPSEAVAELERGLNITEEVMRHLVTRIERPSSARRPGRAEDGEAIDELDARRGAVAPAGRGRGRARRRVHRRVGERSRSPRHRLTRRVAGGQPCR